MDYKIEYYTALIAMGTIIGILLYSNFTMLNKINEKFVCEDRTIELKSGQLCCDVNNNKKCTFTYQIPIFKFDDIIEFNETN